MPEVAPDLELREKVARRLGWKPEPTIATDMLGNPWPVSQEPPAYEQSLAAAEAVLEWLTAHGWDISIQKLSYNYSWDVQLIKDETHVNGFERSLAMSLCRAFVQVPEDAGRAAVEGSR